MEEPHETIVQRAEGGDRQALASLLERHLPTLHAFVRLRCNRFVRDNESSADIVQTVCREVLEGSDRFEARTESHFRNWLLQRAGDRIRDRLRFYQAQKRDVRRARALPAATDSSSCRDVYVTIAGPVDEVMGREFEASFESAFQALPEDYQRVITLVRIIGLSHRETAAEMNRTEASVRNLLTRALKQLSFFLAKERLRGREAGA